MAKIQHLTSAQKLGNALKRIRQEQKLSQAELAKKMRMRQPTISAIENGQGGNLQSLFKIIQTLKINLSVEGPGATPRSTTSQKTKELLEMLDG
jgi:HTH-type transcriptional regulator / antitoxin HipB